MLSICLHNRKTVLLLLAFIREQTEETAEPVHQLLHAYIYIYAIRFTNEKGESFISRCCLAQCFDILITLTQRTIKEARNENILGNTYGHGVVQGVVVDTGSQGVIQHAIFKQLQGFCHFFMKIFHGFISTCKVQVIRVQSANGICVSKRQRKLKLYLHDNSNQKGYMCVMSPH